jgi:undecaprenyl-diphosphatase
MIFLKACSDSGFCPGSAIRQIDQKLFSLVNGLDFTGSDLLLGWVTWLGDAGVATVLAILGLLILDRRRFWQNFLFIVGAMLLSSIAVHLLKAGVARPRPLIEMGGMLPDGRAIHVLFKELTQKSFPSGHSQTVFGLAAGFQLLFAPRLRWLYLLAGWVALSRIYIGAHFPLDVLAGGLLGVLGVDLMAKIWRPSHLRISEAKDEN